VLVGFAEDGACVADGVDEEGGRPVGGGVNAEGELLAWVVEEFGAEAEEEGLVVTVGVDFVGVRV